MHHTLDVTRITKDEHISQKYGFILSDEDGIEVFSSGLVYSSVCDAEQAADDATTTARYWSDDNYLELGQ